MRASLIVASHNEGAALGNTLESCIASCGDLDYEIVVVDDASTDGSAEDVERRFPQVRLHRQPRRQGASPTKALGARQARGEVLVFLDGHCLPEGAALSRLVEDVERVGGDVVTPQISALDVKRWRNDPGQVGNGYALDLLTFQCEWQGVGQMRPIQEAGQQFFESPALIGCAFAVGRDVYEKLWGFDPQMRYWGREDLDFSLKCWLMGRRILHDPKAVVGHRFQSRFDKYTVPIEHVIVNELRTGRKHFTPMVWEAWVQQRQERDSSQLADCPEGVWARAWLLFQAGRSSVEQERSYLHAKRTRDEFWYAERFHLRWPRLQSTGLAAQRSFGQAGPSPSPGPSPGPSPSPPPSCNVTGIVPASIALFVGEPQQFVAQGSNLGAVQWTTSAGANPATGTGPTFTTRWSANGKQTVTATCGAVSKTANVTVRSIEVQINNTAATNDDLVVVKCDHPPQRFNVPCQIRLVGPAAGNANVVLINPDGRLRFPTPGNTTLNITLAGNGAFSAFQISGENPSAALGDSVIHVREDTATGWDITTKKVTVVSFDQGKITLAPGGNYGFAPDGVTYTVTGGVAVSFNSSARIRPAGVDCTAPQITKLRVAIMQETSNRTITRTWNTPTIAWVPATAAGTKVTLSNSMRISGVLDPAVPQPINDGTPAAAHPLYNNAAGALQPPQGCAGGAAAQSNDTPAHPVPTTFHLDVQVGGVKVATGTWTNRVNTTRQQHFRTFCVMFDQVSRTFFSLREATWDMNVDSSVANQHATSNADAAATADPAAGVQANTVGETTTTSPFGAATTDFTK